MQGLEKARAICFPKYPEIGYDDVCVLKKKMDTRSDRHFNKLDVYDASQ